MVELDAAELGLVHLVELDATELAVRVAQRGDARRRVGRGRGDLVLAAELGLVHSVEVRVELGLRVEVRAEQRGDARRRGALALVAELDAAEGSGKLGKLGYWHGQMAI